MTSPTTAHPLGAAPALCADTPLTPAADGDDSGASVLPLVDFKWLMAGEGHRIDVSRLQRDRAYARGCIALANASTCSALREAGLRMGRLLKVVAPRV